MGGPGWVGLGGWAWVGGPERAAYSMYSISTSMWGTLRPTPVMLTSLSGV